MKLQLFFIIVYVLKFGNSFVPAALMKSALFKLDGRFDGNLGKVGETKTHDEITKEGLIQSVVYYFYEQPGGSSKINLTKMNDYYDIRRLYFDYYGRGLCEDDIPFKKILDDIEVSVASIDFDSSTKDLPYAHFDAEAFVESNDRVIEYFRQINYSIKYNDFEDAREKSGKILHTIQDFYSHSNWVESGKENLQSLIGTESFNNLLTSSSMKNVCTNDVSGSSNSKCTLIEEKCGYLATIAAKVLNAIGLAGKYVSCPLKYYDCKDNIRLLNVLVSGYYTGQETNDGVKVVKPDDLNKCSHGGILDGSSFVEAKGGINKDSGYILFSPHARLHADASRLAIAHTKKFFDDIRAAHPDKFARFLDLEIDNATLSKYKNVSCMACKLNFRTSILFSLLVFCLLIFL